MSEQRDGEMPSDREIAEAAEGGASAMDINRRFGSVDPYAVQAAIRSALERGIVSLGPGLRIYPTVQPEERGKGS